MLSPRRNSGRGNTAFKPTLSFSLRDQGFQYDNNFQEKVKPKASNKLVKTRLASSRAPGRFFLPPTEFTIRRELPRQTASQPTTTTTSGLISSDSVIGRIAHMFSLSCSSSTESMAVDNDWADTSYIDYYTSDNGVVTINKEGIEEITTTKPDAGTPLNASSSDILLPPPPPLIRPVEMASPTMPTVVAPQSYKVVDSRPSALEALVASLRTEFVDQPAIKGAGRKIVEAAYKNALQPGEVVEDQQQPEGHVCWTSIFAEPSIIAELKAEEEEAAASLKSGRQSSSIGTWSSSNTPSMISTAPTTPSGTISDCKHVVHRHLPEEYVKRIRPQLVVDPKPTTTTTSVDRHLALLHRANNVLGLEDGSEVVDAAKSDGGLGCTFARVSKAARGLVKRGPKAPSAIYLASIKA